MENNERVVVVAPLDRKEHKTKKVFVSSIHALGLTGYGDTMDESTLKVKRMFAAFVEVHRKYGTLEETLNKSGLTWYWESEYKGSGLKPVEVLSAVGGVVDTIDPDGKSKKEWTDLEKELVVAG